MSCPVLNRNAPSARAWSMTASASWILTRVGAKVTSSGSAAARAGAGGAGERAGLVDDRFGFVDIDPSGRESDLERQPGVARGAASRVRLGEGAARSLARVDRLGRTVETDLDRAHRQSCQTLGGNRIESLTIGFDLELDARVAEQFGDGEEMRHDHRFAAAKHYIRHFAADQLASEVERFARSEEH